VGGVGTKIHIIMSGFDLMTCLHDGSSIRFYEQVQPVLTQVAISEYENIFLSGLCLRI
jgi:hypothetical protein